MKKLSAVLTLLAVALLSSSSLQAARSFSSELGAAVPTDAGTADIDTPGMSGVFSDGETLVMNNINGDDAFKAAILNANQPSEAQVQAIRDGMQGDNPLESILNALRAAIANSPADAGPLAMAALQVYTEITGATNTQAAFQSFLATALGSIPSGFDEAIGSVTDLIALALASEGTNGTQQALAVSLFEAAVDRFGGNDPDGFAANLGITLVDSQLATVMRTGEGLLAAAAAGALDDASNDIFGFFGGDQGAINQGAILPNPSGGGGGGGGSSPASGTQPNPNNNQGGGNTPTPVPPNPSS